MIAWASWTEPVSCAQGGSSRQRTGAYEQQPVYTSMAGEDGSLVMLEPLFTDGDEVLPPKQQEAFVLLDGIPQVRSLACPFRSLILITARKP